MPLLVQCPRGCQVKMPRSRSGKVVRCPDCKCAMRVPQLTEAQLKMGRVIPCRAKLARRRKLDPEEAAQRKKELQDQEAETQRLQVEAENRERALADKLASQTVEEVVEESQQRKSDAAVEPTLESASQVPAGLAANDDAAVGDRQNEHDSVTAVDDVAEVSSPTPPPTDLLDLPETPEPPKPRRRKLAKPAVATAAENSSLGFTPFINLADPSIEPEQEKDWQERLSVANNDRRLFARFFAICLCLVAVLNVIPAGLQWYHWTQLTDSAPLPRWIYIQLFIGAVYLLYAVFLAQIPDWSALRAVSVAMLFMAFVFGIISTGLLVGGHGDFSGYLGIPFALNRQACIWCVAMLCVATLMSFWGGKESAHWQRAEQILQNIVTKTG